MLTGPPARIGTQREGRDVSVGETSKEEMEERREVREEQRDGQRREGRDISHLCVSTITDGSPTFLLKICFKNSHPLPA